MALLPLLISGYLFNLIFYPFRYFSSRAEGQKLFFMAAGSGLFLGAAVFIGTSTPWPFVDRGSSDAVLAVNSAIPVPHGSRLLLTLLFAIALAYVLNGLLWLGYLRRSKPTARCVYDKLTGVFGNPLDQLFRRAAESQKLVIVTLRSRKVYCGRITETPGNLNDAGAFIELLPSFSGFRDKDTLRFGDRRTEYPVITLWEAKQYIYSLQQVLALVSSHLGTATDPRVQQILSRRRQRLEHDLAEARAIVSDVGEPPGFDPNDWVKVLPVAEVESASFYDSRAYDVWFKEPEDVADQPERPVAV